MERDGLLPLRRDGMPVALENSKLASTDALEALRIPIRFEGRGLQFASLDVANGKLAFNERIFTLVEALFGFWRSVIQGFFQRCHKTGSNLTSAAVLIFRAG